MIDEARTEADLVSAAQGGDREALERLLRQHHDRVYGLCRRLTGNDADAADASQEALIAIVRGLPRFDGRAKFGTWAYRVATNACLDELRRRRRRPEPGLPEDSMESEGLGAGASTQSMELSAGLLAERIDIDVALATLAHDFRVAVVLRDQCGLAYEEIAEVVGVPVGTVRSRISRGRAMLVAGLGASYMTGASREPAVVRGTSKLESETTTTMTTEPTISDPAANEDGR